MAKSPNLPESEKTEKLLQILVDIAKKDSISNAEIKKLITSKESGRLGEKFNRDLSIDYKKFTTKATEMGDDLHVLVVNYLVDLKRQKQEAARLKQHDKDVKKLQQAQLKQLEEHKQYFKILATKPSKLNFKYTEEELEKVQENIKYISDEQLKQFSNTTKALSKSPVLTSAKLAFKGLGDTLINQQVVKGANAYTAAIKGVGYSLKALTSVRSFFKGNKDPFFKKIGSVIPVVKDIQKKAANAKKLSDIAEEETARRAKGGLSEKTLQKSDLDEFKRDFILSTLDWRKFNNRNTQKSSNTATSQNSTQKTSKPNKTITTQVKQAIRQSKQVDDDDDPIYPPKKSKKSKITNTIDAKEAALDSFKLRHILIHIDDTLTQIHDILKSNKGSGQSSIVDSAIDVASSASLLGGGKKLLSYAPRALKAIPRIAKGAGKYLGKTAKFLGKRAPLIGGIISAATTQGSLGRKLFAGAGSMLGGIGGAALGSVAGPVGTVAGGIGGTYAGEKGGTWLYDSLFGSKNTINTPVPVVNSQPVLKENANGQLMKDPTIVYLKNIEKAINNLPYGLGKVINGGGKGVSNDAPSSQQQSTSVPPAMANYRPYAY